MKSIFFIFLAVPNVSTKTEKILAEARDFYLELLGYCIKLPEEQQGIRVSTMVLLLASIMVEDESQLLSNSN